MAGLFGLFDYTKPGKGVEKDAPPKRPAAIFFDVLARKFWKILAINFLYALFNLPAIALLYVSLQFLFPNPAPENASVDLFARLFTGMFFLATPVICVGPVQAGVTFLLRNYAREEHAFIWGDFLEHARKNMKDGIVVCLFDFAALIVFGLALNFYVALARENLWAIATLGVTALAFTLFIFAHIYIYPMMVTFKLTVRQLYKNALIFAILKFFPNLGIVVIIGALCAAAAFFWPAGMLLYFFLLYGIFGLMINSWSNRVLKKYLIDGGAANNPQER